MLEADRQRIVKIINNSFSNPNASDRSSAEDAINHRLKRSALGARPAAAPEPKANPRSRNHFHIDMRRVARELGAGRLRGSAEGSAWECIWGYGGVAT